MIRTVITCVFALTVSVSNLIGTSYQSHAAEIRYQKAQVNTIIPDDVMNEFLSAPQTVKEKHCTNNSNYAYQEIARLAKNPNFNPHEVLQFSHKKIWWRCSKGHEYQTSIAHRTKEGTGCWDCYNERKRAKTSLIKNKNQLDLFS